MQQGTRRVARANSAVTRESWLSTAQVGALYENLVMAVMAVMAAAAVVGLGW
jgi:hypothetical protein